MLTGLATRIAHYSHRPRSAVGYGRNDGMKFGWILPNNWGVRRAADVIELGVRAEALGYHAVWVNHHVLNVGYVGERLGDRPYYDALTTLTWIGARTERLRLGTSVLVLPYLNPLVLAKTVAALDVFSGGRVTLGVGVGSLPAENRALGSDYATRGAYANESIAVMRELWTAPEPSFAGRFFRFDGFKFAPKPLQPGGVPILVGGGSRAALLRCARLGDGWHPMEVPVGLLRERVHELRQLWSEHGRGGAPPRIVARCEMDLLDEPAVDRSAPMVGTVEQLLETIAEYQQIGVSELALSTSTANVHRIRRLQEQFATRVIPRVTA